MKNIETCADQEFARTIMYQFLAMALYEPAENLFKVLEQSDDTIQLLEASHQFIGPQGEKMMQGIFGALHGINDNREALLLDLKVEYNRLFVGPMSPVCPPYESFFDTERPIEGQKTLMGPTSDAMDAALRSEGLELTLDYAEFPDQAAIELEFMFYLLSRAYSGEKDSKVYLKKANAFLIEHLAPWLPEFGAKVSVESRHPFYQGIGRLLEATVKADFGSVTSQKQ